MTETTERTAELDKLREDLARALGYTVAFDCTHWHVLTPEGYTLGWTVYEERAEGMFSAVIPDWPRNDGAALVVCAEIGAANNWTLEISKPLVSYIARFTGGTITFSDRGVRVAAVQGDKPAEALTRLALAALRE